MSEYTRTARSLASERAWELANERWNEAVESLETDLENLTDYRRRIEQRKHDVLDTIEEARGYLILAAQSLDALERLAR